MTYAHVELCVFFLHSPTPQVLLGKFQFIFLLLTSCLIMKVLTMKNLFMMFGSILAALMNTIAKSLLSF